MKIQFNQASFSYGDKNVLEDITVSLNLDGKCIAMLGHNGAGKSTLLNILCGIFKGYKGDMIFSESIKIAYLPFENPVYDKLTLRDNLLFWFQLMNEERFSIECEKVKNLVSDFGLNDLLDQQVRFLSSGEQRKAALACILLGEANLLVLDEPFNGLDAITVSELCEIIMKYKTEGKSIIITSHQLEVVLKLSDQILILKEGKLVFNSSKDKIEESLISTYLKTYEK